ncbi:transposase [Anabaena sp. UHCC 0187]|uniref:transposase n=1 Tax=Anabaena sp. UHCC 0187 TaxID=2590018 RepID=UPI001445CF62|nr:transposase [Anabaena sp. UHCC 0187]MDP5018807.1 transposase [Dolichospermum sp.]MTJ11639.1 transposase [Anabaena sp. UHCC 0187]
MKYNPKIHHRQSIRLRGYDYSEPGAYFITICTQNRECNLGEIINGEMKLTVRGFIIDEFWLKIPEHFPNVELDEFVVMPNHVHGIIVINDNFNEGRKHQQNHEEARETEADRDTEAGGETPPLRKKTTLGQIIAYYKYQTTKIINQIDDTPGMRIWQRNYYDRIIRNQKILDIARQYIFQNPLRWNKDPNNPYKLSQSY